MIRCVLSALKAKGILECNTQIRSLSGLFLKTAHLSVLDMSDNVLVTECHF